MNRTNILGRVKELHDRIGGENLGEGDIRELMKTIKKNTTEPGDPLEGTSQMYKTADPDLAERDSKYTKNTGPD